MDTISQLETAEFQLVDLLSRLAHLPARQRDDANAALAELRKVKAAIIARNPDILRKRLDNMDKRTHQDARNQKLHQAAVELVHMVRRSQSAARRPADRRWRGRAPGHAV